MTALIIGLAVTAGSARSIVISGTHTVPVNAGDREGPWMCPPTLSEILWVKGPPLNIGASILFIAGLIVVYHSARHLIEEQRRS